MTYILPPDAQAVFFDFDGVILDTVHVKTEAFATLFRPYGSDVEREVVHFQMEHGGLSRFIKFRHAIENILGETATEERLAELGQQFADLVYDSVLEASFMPGAKETLDALHGALPMYVVSGTPEEELLRIVRARKLDGYFAAVLGSPRPKPEIVMDELTRAGFTAARSLFVGDASTDYDTARAVAMPFLGIVPAGAPSPFPQSTAISPRVAIRTAG